MELVAKVAATAVAMRKNSRRCIGLDFIPPSPLYNTVSYIKYTPAVERFITIGTSKHEFSLPCFIMFLSSTA
jgi:hypothetical protein